MRCLTTFPADLGESPRWDQKRGWIWFVDLTEGILHAIDRSGEPRHRTTFPDELCSIAVADDGSLALLRRSGLYHYQPQTRTATLVAHAPYDPATHLFNDCGVDADGVLWAGIAAEDESPGAGSLVRWSPDDGFAIARSRMTLPNGIGWTPDGKARHVVDSLHHEITTNVAGSHVTQWHVPEHYGLPDGLTVDADGDLWIAYWGGARVRRHRPDGTVLAEYALPVELVTAPLLVPSHDHDDHATLLVTTARTTLSHDALAEQPRAGHVFATEVPAAAMPPNLITWRNHTDHPPGALPHQHA